MSGCVATIVKDPFYVSEEFKPADEQAITVLPAIRLGVSPDLDTEFDVEGRIKGEIISRGYRFIDKTKISLPMKVTSEMLDKQDFDWVNQLNLEKDTWALIIVIETLKREQYGLGLRGSSILSGYLIDTSTGKVVWEGAGFGADSKGVFAAAIVDDLALQKGERDLIRSLPLNTAAKNKPEVSGFTLDEYYKFAVVKGQCRNSKCNDKDSKAHICVAIDKSNSFLNSDNDDDEGSQTIATYQIYDTRRKIADLEVGSYTCWSKDPGKAIVYINMNRPAYFIAKAGKSYFLDAKYGKGWRFEEIAESKMNDIQAAYKKL
jgi:hypothetical protein